MTEQSKLVYDFFYIGQDLPVYTHTVTEEEIDNFCQSFKENNPMYLDDTAARKLGFDGRIAPPMMVRRYAHIQNVLRGFRETVPGHSIHASGEYLFECPVRPGDTVTTTGKVTDKYLKKDRKFLSFELTTKNQRGDTVVINRHTSVWPR